MRFVNRNDRKSRVELTLDEARLLADLAVGGNAPLHEEALELRQANPWVYNFAEEVK
jgi:hypothetical protein